MRTIEEGELDWAANEQNRLIVEDPVVVALVGLDLDGPTVEITNGVGLSHSVMTEVAL